MKKLAFLVVAVALAAGCGGGANGERAAREQPTVAAGQVPFDRAFIDAMVPHHRGAIDMVDQAFAGMMIGHYTGAIRMAELAHDKADHDEVKTLTGDIIAAQQREIDIMKAFFKGGHG